MAKAAGIMFLTAAGEVLLLQRAPGQVHGEEWDFPGGTAEGDETAEETACRECVEEIGSLPDGPRALLTRRIAEGVDYTTFVQRVPEPFVPTLNAEHIAFMWAKPEALLSGATAAADADFVEAEHPRNEDGKFAEGAGGGRATLKETKTEGGKRLQASGEPLPSHIENLKLPPAWTDVRYSEDPKSDLLAVGKDSKGRVQSVYSEAFSAGNAAAKFARIEELRGKFGYVSKQNEDAQRSTNPKTRDSADCLSLIMKMGVRPGSDDDTGAKVKAYGATTLEGRHVVETPEGVSLRFVGKKGVSLDLPVHDQTLATMLMQRANSAGAHGKLFAATNNKALLDHTHSLNGGGFKTKDFRTYVGTVSAYDLVQGSPKPTTMAEYKKRVMDVARQVSKKLGNTPVIALQSYINPAVFAEWRIAA